MHTSLEEYQAKAMLLDMVYDPRDHTLNKYHEGVLPVDVFDADTMELLAAGYVYDNRVDEVSGGKLGPAWLHVMTIDEREEIWLKANMFPRG